MLQLESLVENVLLLLAQHHLVAELFPRTASCASGMGLVGSTRLLN